MSDVTAPPRCRPGRPTLGSALVLLLVLAAFAGCERKTDGSIIIGPFDPAASAGSSGSYPNVRKRIITTLD